MKNVKKFFLLSCAIYCTACSGNGNTGNSDGQDIPKVDDSQLAYHNPVIRIAAPDPTAMRAKDGYFYLYATEDIRNLPIFRSRDMVKWEEIGTAFTDETRPDFLPDNKDVKERAHLWAPEIRYVKGKYVLFYSLAQWGNHWVSTVGYAVSDSPEGPFTPKGKVFDSREVNVENSIDQYFYEEDGKYYMLWGSFFGIYIMELDVTDDVMITPKLDTKRQIAATLTKESTCGNATGTTTSSALSALVAKDRKAPTPQLWRVRKTFSARMSINREDKCWITSMK